MPEIMLPFGKGTQPLFIGEEDGYRVLMPNRVSAPQNEGELIRESLLSPIGAPRLCDLVKTGEKVCIVTSDVTRPMPSALVLPYVLEELALKGVKDSDITVVLGLGSHRPHTEGEKRALVGDRVFERVRVLDSDPSDCVRLTVLKNGTPLDVFRPVYESDRRVLLGNIEYHYFAGYSGGMKAIMPGVSSKEAIQKNHSQMLHQNAYAGSLDQNPVRQDIDEARLHLPVDFIVNVVLDDHKKVIGAFSGDCMKAHRKGCAFLDTVYGAELLEQYDIVVASPGGYPKDINIYQAQKGLDNASHACRAGGVIIWVAECLEGYGESTFEHWMKTMRPEQMLSEIRREFKLGGHKAAAIAKIMQQSSIYMVTALAPNEVRALGMLPFRSVQEAFAHARAALGAGAKALVMPAAGSTLPIFRP